MTRQTDLALARSVVRTEIEALESLEGTIGASFAAAVDLILSTDRHIIIAGVGKSGHIGQKIAASLASTGTPAFFLHPTEASHGDLGMITDADVVIAVSNSGETDELLTILPVLRRQGNPMIAMTGRRDSTLARLADVHLDVSVPAEACPLGLAPTSSTTAALVMGDIADGEPVLGRIHSECLTGDALFSLRCDCGFQLQAGHQDAFFAGPTIAGVLADTLHGGQT